MKILIIDDNSDITKVFADILNSEGNETSFSNDGKEGLRKIKENHYDVVFLDLAMPSFSGYDVLSDLEKEGILTKSKVILFTATPISDDELQRWTEKGLHSCLKKPVRLNAIKEKLNSIR